MYEQEMLSKITNIEQYTQDISENTIDIYYGIENTINTITSGDRDIINELNATKNLMGMQVILTMTLILYLFIVRSLK